MGEVVETGKDVKNLQKGDRVVIPFVIACGDCFFCRLQQYAACENTNAGKGAALNKKQIPAPAALFGYSHLYGGVPGGQAEYVRVPKGNVGPFKVPPLLSDDKALFLSDILPTAWQAAKNAQIQQGSSVAVYIQAKQLLLSFVPGTFIGACATFAGQGDWKLVLPSLALGLIFGYAMKNSGLWLAARSAKIIHSSFGIFFCLLLMRWCFVPCTIFPTYISLWRILLIVEYDQYVVLSKRLQFL